jgi:hypothetical protein
MGLLDHKTVRDAIEREGYDYDFEAGTTDKAVREKIVFTLSVYPVLSGSMLQVGIGTSLPPTIWRPNYEALKKAGIIHEQNVTLEAPGGRMITYTKISLALPIAEAIARARAMNGN